jgi:ERF superfamily
MHRSSDTIGNISGALAKAQAELTNPEKSLVAIIRSPFPGEADRTFRYAPLSSGLDIVRKSLGRHEIATIQSTEIDKESDLLRLRTVLAHSSGEWISSEWPVCPMSDIASAQRMGAALTYARRYALFTLVGIAGEDDLDAPDLGAAPKPAAELPRHGSQSNGQAAAGKRTAHEGGKRPESAAARSVLGAQLSASLRESLIEQMAAINSADEAAAWAHRNLRAKNTLSTADAKMVEEQFRARLSAICPSHGTCDGPAAGAVPDDPGGHEPAHAVPGKTGVSGASDAGPRQNASMLAAKKQSRSDTIRALGKMVRLRDKDHRRFVLRQACLVCGRVPSDPHHLTFTQPRALARRVSDEFIVPVCRVHHRDLHRSGNEAAWWRKLNIDPLPVALRLWQHTRSDREIAPMTQAVKTPDASTHDQARPDAGTELEPAAQGAAPAGASESGDHGAGS